MRTETRRRVVGRPHSLTRFVLRLVLLGVVAIVVSAVAADEAHAQGKLIDLHGAILGGGMLGRGSGGDQDLFYQTQGGGVGAEVGARLLVLDLSIRFLQMVSTDGYRGTLLSALVGPSVEIPVVHGGKDRQGKNLPPKVVVRPGLAAGFGLGTLVPVKPPLTNDQLAGKGLLIMGRFAVERMFGPVIGIGAEIQGGYHYLFGASAEVNGQDHSSGWQMGGFGTLAIHLGV